MPQRENVHPGGVVRCTMGISDDEKLWCNEERSIAAHWALALTMSEDLVDVNAVQVQRS
jgi:hypothetical protein